MCAQWNVADYFKDNKDKLLCNNSGGDSSKQRGASREALADSSNTIDSTISGTTDPQELVYPDFPGVTTLAEMSEFDKLWMCLFTKLGEYANIKYYNFCNKMSMYNIYCKIILVIPMHISGELCIDPRPAVRKSAGQTLLSTISAHANLLTPSSWNAVLWQVINSIDLP